ncbi:hypothetical protein AZH53_00510 [Methanomicrobiaceae archaeon CYW5]|uniref:ABC1 kinase family protein n=1 Tax=Methanovulcanius yangii TaxID=1789227 RepID=UPI0029CA1E82|nr:AarF/UbiB family protein [Methanovulcanius yangii]MBT8506911.1 hypothetical protein [Methanovulcanius yangii]
MVRLLRRYREMVQILVRHGFGVVVNEIYPGSAPLEKLKKHPDTEHAATYVSIREAIVELGPVFIKFGQILSTRSDLLPPGLVAELKTLTDDVPPVPFSEIRPALEEAFGPLDEAEVVFDEEPVAAASLSQVHLATLAGGRRVAVKVRRPGIAETIENDLVILENLARRIEERYPHLRVYNPTGLVGEFARQIRSEIDFILDGKNADQLRRNMRTVDGVVVPRIYWETTTHEVLTMEYREGVRIDDVDALRALHHDTRAICTAVFTAYIKQIFEDGFFHADPHPGNLLVGPDGRVVFLDFGMVGVLRPQRRETYTRLLLAIADDDIEEVAACYRRLGVAITDVDADAFMDDTYAVFQQYRNVEANQFDMALVLTQIPEILRKYRLTVPTTMMLVIKVIVMMLSVAERLDASFNFTRSVSPFLAGLATPRLYQRGDIHRAARHASDVAASVRDFPLTLNRALHRLAGGDFAIELKDTSTREMALAMKYASSMLLIGLVISSLVIGSSLIILAAGLPFDTAACTTIVDLTLIGYIVAVIIGIYAVYTVLRHHAREEK